jgi:hypothetical protein
MLNPSLGAAWHIWPWLVIAGGLIVTGGFAIVAIRGKIKDSEALQADFTLADLKDMLAQGKLTDVEYKSAREIVLRRMEKKLSDNDGPKRK